MTWGCDICVAGGGGRPGPESAVVMNAGVWVWWGVAWACVGLVYLFQWFESPVKDVEVLLFVLVAGALVFEEFDEPEPSFLPLSPLKMYQCINSSYKFYSPSQLLTTAYLCSG